MDSRMSRNKAGNCARCAMWAALAAMLPVSCTPFTSIFFPSAPITPAEYPLVFKEGPKKGKEVVVAIFISAAPGIGPEFTRSEEKLASDIATKLPEMAKENKQKLIVLDPTLVSKFKLKNPNWKLIHASERGRALGADFVLDISLDKMSFYQPGSQNKLYEGRAEVTVSVYNVDAGPGEPIYNYSYPFLYPHTGAFDTSAVPLHRFKQEFLNRLATEISMKHIDYRQRTVEDR